MLVLILCLGGYSGWVYEKGNESADGYCAYSPFMFAFVLLIIEWILMPLFICGICCMICGMCVGRNDLNH